LPDAIDKLLHQRIFAHGEYQDAHTLSAVRSILNIAFDAGFTAASDNGSSEPRYLVGCHPSPFAICGCDNYARGPHSEGFGKRVFNLYVIHIACHKKGSMFPVPRSPFPVS
jgi:hypothetical protein